MIFVRTCHHERFEHTHPVEDFVTVTQSEYTKFGQNINGDGLI